MLRFLHKLLNEMKSVESFKIFCYILVKKLDGVLFYICMT